MDTLGIADANALLRKRGWFPVSGGSGEEHENDDDENGNGNAGASGHAAGSEGAGAGEQKPKSYSDADVEVIVKQRLARERTKIATAVKQELEEAAKLEKAKADGDLQKIIDAQKVELDQYNSIKPIVVEYEELAEQRYQEALKTLPEALRLLAPDDDSTALDKERWLTKKALPAVAKLKGMDDTGSKGSNGANGKPKLGNNPPEFEALSQTSKKTIDDIIKAYRGRGAYRSLM